MTAMRSMLAAFAVGCGPAAALAQGPPPAAPAPPSDPAPQPVATLPIELIGNRIFVSASGPGFADRRFLVDTGAAVTHFTSELVAEAGIATGAAIGVAGLVPQGAAAVEAEGVALGLGGSELRVGRAVALPRAVLAGSERGFDGIIGADLFAAFIVEIDYERRLIRLFERGRWRPAAEAEPLALTLLDGKPYAEGSLHLAGGERLPALLQLDTGFGGAIGISKHYADRSELLARIGRHIPSAVRGIGGEAPARLARIEGLALGGLVLPEPLVTVSLVEGAGVRRDTAGRIGGALLRRFRIAFDYAGSAVYLEPNASFARVLEVDMSGLSLVVKDGIEVGRVAPGSPAAEAGIAAGDRLLEVDGRRASDAGLEAVRASFFGEGAIRMLRLSRRGRLFTVALKLRRRI